MAKIKFVKGDDNVHRWVNEYGHHVCIALYTEFGAVHLEQERDFKIQLFDPSLPVDEKWCTREHYVLLTDSHNIYSITKATPNSNNQILGEYYDYSDVDELELLAGQYQYFGVCYEPYPGCHEQVTMKDYYENEFFKPASEA